MEEINREVSYEKTSSSGSQTSPLPTAVRVESIQDNETPYQTTNAGNVSNKKVKKPWWHPIKEPGSAIQIVLAAALALGIGLGVSSATDVPDAATTLLAIPGQLWLRALTCVGKWNFRSWKDCRYGFAEL